MTSLFISHSDGKAAIQLETILREAFPGGLEVFNTSRADSGLAAGSAIDMGVMERIRDAGVIVWLATPRSVVKSFWMAWEMGAATALQKTVIPVRCYGLRPESLPLLQGGVNAPDIGEREGLKLLLRSVKDKLGLREDRIAEVLNEEFTDHEPSKLWGQRSPGAVKAALLGNRLLLENRTDSEMTFLNANVSSKDDTPLSIDFIDRVPSLGVRGRRIVDLPASQATSMGEGRIQLEWRADDGGRYFSSFVVGVDSP